MRDKNRDPKRLEDILEAIDNVFLYVGKDDMQTIVSDKMRYHAWGARGRWFESGNTDRKHNNMSEDIMDVELADVSLVKCGFYTNDPEEFEKRIDEIEDSLNKAEYVFDDPQEWIEIDDFMVAMREEHSWLW